MTVVTVGDGRGGLLLAYFNSENLVLAGMVEPRGFEPLTS